MFRPCVPIGNPGAESETGIRGKTEVEFLNEIEFAEKESSFSRQIGREYEEVKRYRKGFDKGTESHVISIDGGFIVSNLAIVICEMIVIISYKPFKRQSGLLGKTEVSNVLYSRSGLEIDS